MPEACEVRVISEYLNKVWSGKLIIGMGWDSKSKFNKTGIKNMDLVKVPCKVVGVFSRGKLIIIECINQEGMTIYMISQLGMEGKWVHTKEKHSNFRIYFGNLNSDKNAYIIEDTWYYDDSRHFGHFNVYSDLKEPEKNHGPCLLTTALVNNGIVNQNNLRSYQIITNIIEFKNKIQNKRISNKAVCEFLMEQQHLSGVGNYLRVEILYRAKIHPNKTIGSFTDHDVTNLYNNIIDQMLIAYGAKGLTIKSYWDPEGNAGKCPLQVYKKDIDPNGNKVERFKDKKGRMMHWVPAVQIN